VNALAVLLAALVGYFVGTISPATLIARGRGVDIAQSGSGNPGATNAGRLLGRRTGIVVGLLDVAKGLVPTLVFLPYGVVPPLVAGVAAVLGHCTSPWLRGHGGKGVATSLGAILGVHPLAALGCVVVFAVVFAVTRWVALASVAAAGSLLLGSVVLGSHYASEGAPFEQLATVLWAAALALIVLWRHKNNLVDRWRHGPRRPQG
jgi:glycerol-3-phosphate acyltransferase PlsY